jgi:predicted esterase
MLRVWLRRYGAKAVVCLLVVLFSTAVWSRDAHAQAGPVPIELEENEDEPGVSFYAARAPGVRPVTVVLHGMCSEPRRACRHFAERITETEHLICPRARQRCEGGGSIWSGRGFEADIEAAVHRAFRVLPADENAPRTLIGYSLGAFRALSLAQSSARYPRVMLIGAKVYPDLRALRANGVNRLLFAAGSWDMMHDHMQRQSRQLARAGFDARFLGLGPVGHLFEKSFADYLPDALAYLREDF